MIDYISCLDRALLDEKLLARAKCIWSETAADVMTRNHDRKPGSLRTSDAGRCQRELYAQVNGLYDLPENAEDLLLKMNQGTLSGAWQACLIASALEHEGYWVELEEEVFIPGTPPRTGHADISIYPEGRYPSPAKGSCLEVVDCKWTAWSGEIDPPDIKSRYQCLSTASYAIELGAPTFVILTSAPASRKEKRKQWRYTTADWEFEVQTEYQRLANGLQDEMPPCDPRESWRGKKCRFSGCGQKCKA